MNIAFSMYRQLQGWSWLKRTLMTMALAAFLSSSFLFLTPLGTNLRLTLADTIIATQHRSWAWILVGVKKRDEMINSMMIMSDNNSKEPQDLSAINIKHHVGDLIKVEDISGSGWVGKKMYVYDPKALRVVVPNKVGEGERITSMVQRTGAVAGINAGGFDDPDGLGNGFAPIGVIMSGGNILFTSENGTVPQHVVAFDKDGKLIIGKYSIDELLKMNVKDAVSFYPRVIANGKPLPIQGDGRNPRTAIGQRADGVIIIMVIDGRQTHSIGASLKDVQDLMLEEGAVNAGFLDGGASSEMVVGGELITKPASRYGERRLPSALLVFDDPSKVVVPNIWAGLTYINPGGAFDHPQFQQELKNKPKTTPTPKPTPTATRKPESSGSPVPSESPSSTPVSPNPSPTGSGSPNPSVSPTGSSSPNASGKPDASPTVKP